MKTRLSNLGLAAAIAAWLVSCTQPGYDPGQTSFLIDSMKSRYVEDSRTEVFDITQVLSGDTLVLRGKTTVPEAADRLMQLAARLPVIVCDSIIRLPDPALGSRNWGLVRISVINIRYTPDQAAEMATQALMGTPVRVLQSVNGWYLVQTPDQYIAWTETSGIHCIDESELRSWNQGDRLMFTGDFGLVESRRESGSAPVCDIVTGAIVQRVPGQSAGCKRIEVLVPDGRRGFLDREAFRTFSEWKALVRPDSANLVSQALHYIGRPYLWGGTSVKGFDCSGFTKTVYMQSGLMLARDASQQVLQGSEIECQPGCKNYRAGDLLFFGRKATESQRERVTHVGMYIGGSRFIHSSVSACMVGINSLDSLQPEFRPYYLSNLLHVRRMIDSTSMPGSFAVHTWFN